MIDPHVHLRDWKQSNKETIYHGISVASQLGYDYFFDMPNTNPAIVSEDVLVQRLDLAKDAIKLLNDETGRSFNYGVFIGLTSSPSQQKEAVQLWKKYFPKVVGLKMFASQSTGNMGIVKESQQKEVYKNLTKYGFTGVLAVHCEKESFFKAGEPFRSLARPWESEKESVLDQIDFAKEASFKGRLHICHISTYDAIEAVKKTRKENSILISCGATAHHSLLNQDYNGEFCTMNPPLRLEKHRQYVFNSLLDGTIDFVESDHATHTLEDKKNNAGGIPGFEGSLLLINKLREECLSEKKINALFRDNIISTFGLENVSSQNVPLVTDKMISFARSAYPFSGWPQKV
ncbi:MAG: dihydroorotase [Sphaerochaetaceae bacterium]|nr:dihydroorotase [Sphaerochaetaceae bacterium]